MQPQEVPGSEQDFFARGPLGLSEFEKQMLALAKAHSTKLIVLINANSAMMVEELKDDASQYAAELWRVYVHQQLGKRQGQRRCGPADP